MGVGAIIIGAVAVAAAAYSYSAAQSNSKKCNTMLMGWEMAHPTVSFNKVPALTQQSFMTCSVPGGILKPFLSEAAAASASTEIAWTNRSEVGLTGLISFMFGYATGYTLGTSGLIKAGFEVAAGYAGAYLIYAPLSSLEQKGMRAWNDTAAGNTEYDRMISKVEELEGDNEFAYDSFDDDYNPNDVLRSSKKVFNHSVDIFRHNQNERFVERMMNVQGTKAEKRAQREAIAKEMSKTRSGNQAVEAMRRGNGEIYPRQRTQRKGKNAIQPHQEKSRSARGESVKGLKNNALLLALPLFVTPLAEYSLVALSDYAEEDAKKGNSISSYTH